MRGVKVSSNQINRIAIEHKYAYDSKEKRVNSKRDKFEGMLHLKISHV